MPELDEFGIPIKKKKSTQNVDEFGIPVKKKTKVLVLLHQ